MAGSTRRKPDGKTNPPRGGAGRAAKASRTEKPKPKSLPVVQAEREPVGCLSCGLCCTYIVVEINGPTTVKHASEILWHLYHHNVSVYRDSDDEWYVQFETRCQHLADDNKCGIYEVRPHICREYSETSCEVNSDDEGTSFYTAAEFLEYMKTRRKKVYAKLIDGYAPSTPAAIAALASKKNGPFRKKFQALRR